MPPAAPLGDIARRVRSCAACPLAATRTRAVPGEGPAGARVMLVGEAPGATEDARGEPFVGRAGRMLDAELDRAGLSRAALFVTNAVKCRPPGNRKPTPAEVAACAPFLREQVEAIGPDLVVALGASAFHALVDSREPIGQARGRRHPGRLGVPVLATYHPSAILYNRTRKTGAIAADLRGALDAAGSTRKGAPSPAGRAGTFTDPDSSGL